MTVTATDPGGLSASIAFTVTVTSGTVNQDRAALVTLYNATNGPNWSNSNNWLTDAPLEDWHGVTLDASGRVWHLVLRFNELSGQIPSELGNLTNLIWLNLNSNELTGQIPSELGNLSNLESLNLGSNDGLSGQIPSELGNLSNLEYLNLYLTGLSGQIPSELGNLTNLIFLNLNSNELSGQIPSELGNLTNLESLHLHTNGLSGQIPPELGNLTNLIWLDLNSNELTGQIPPELGNLTNLEYLYLYLTGLSGQIPSELGNLTNLILLNLRSNELSGQIPPELGNLTNLQTLNLRSNELSGQIPSELGSLSNLESLWLSFNELSGQIPLELANLGSLEVFAYQHTSLCVPNDNSFRTWLNNIRDHRGTGVDCQGTGAGLIFRDDFNNVSSLEDWEFDNAEGEISEGILRVTNTAGNLWGTVGRELDAPITSWDVATRLGRQADRIQTELFFVVADPGARSTQGFRILIGTRVLDFGGGDTETINYGLQVLFEPEGREPGWYFIIVDGVDFHGISNAINEGPGEFTDFTVRVQDGIFAALAGEETLFAASVGELNFGDAITEITEVHLWTFDPALTAPSLLDWIEVNGVPTGSSTANADHDDSFRLSPSNLTREGAIREASAAAREIPFQTCPPRGCR